MTSLAVNPASIRPFLTIAEAAVIACVSPKRFRNLMADGTLQEGVHYTRPRRLAPRIKRDALLAWLDGSHISGRTTPSAERSSPARTRCSIDPTLLRRVRTNRNGM
jgi:hypothetical protein